MYLFKTGSQSGPELTPQKPRPHQKPQVNLNSSAFAFIRKTSNYKTVFALIVVCFIAFLSGCGGISMNSDFMTKGTAITSTSATLSKISCGTLSLTGAQSKECSVYLIAPAKSSTTVSLSSSNVALRVPTSVVISAGASSMGFTAVSSAVTKSVSVTITGKAGGVTKTAVITLYPAAATTAGLKMVSCGTQTLTGPTTKSCSVYLDTAATSRTVVSLSSNNSALTVPTSVTVPAGSATGGFAVTAAAVSTTQTATLTATADGVTETDAIQLYGTGSTGSTRHKVQLSWDPPVTSEAIVGYRVYRATVGGPSYAQLTTSVDVQTTFTDTTVQSGLTYDYTVKSVDSKGAVSAPSNATVVTVP